MKSWANTFFSAKAVADELNRLLQGAELIESFSITPTELVFNFILNDEKEASFKLDFAKNLTIPRFFFLAQAKSKTWLPQFRGLENPIVQSVVCVHYDRSFKINFTDGSFLLVKLFGKAGNVLWYVGDEAVDAFKKTRKNDLAALASEFPDFDATQTAPEVIEKLVVEAEDFTISQLLQGPKWEVHLNELPPVLHPLKRASTSDPRDRFDSVLNAFALFGPKYLATEEKVELHDQLQKAVNAEIRKAEAKIRELDLRIKDLTSGNRFEEQANILMANLHQIEEGVESVELYDFYHDKPIKLKLKKELSPQKNAERWYSKSKNQRIELEHHKKQLENTEARLLDLYAQKEEIDQLERLNDLRTHFKKLNKNRDEALNQQKFYRFSSEGFEILAGKSAQNNDELLRVARKHELWLHARGVAGSHVIIRSNAGQFIPKSVIEYAASVAAKFSKAKGAETVPVIVTERKFVRKPKGGAAGEVKLDRESVVLVSPLAE